MFGDDKRGYLDSGHLNHAHVVDGGRARVGVATTGPRIIDANDPDSVLQDAKREMTVFAREGTRVGIVDEIRMNDAGRRASIVVLTGRFNRRRKLVDGRLVDWVGSDRLILSLDPKSFKFLPEVIDSQLSSRC